MIIFKKLILFFIPMIICSQSEKQEEFTPQTQIQKEIARKSVTKILNGKKYFGDLILFEDESTKWVPWSEKEINNSKDLLKLKADTTKIFNEYWNTKKLFPYKDEKLESLKDTILIDLEVEGKFYCSLSKVINSKFGWRNRRQHKGIDTHLETGDTLRSAFDGKVRFSGYNDGGYGHLIIIRHFNELETYYAHQSKRFVEAGDIVKAGDVIGLGGETGNAMGPHLHFEIRYHDQPFNPENIIDVQNQGIKEKFKKTDVNGNEKYIYPLTKQDFSWIKKNRSIKYHKIRKGETLGHLGQRYYGAAHKGGERIKKLNKSIINWNSLQIGQKIRVR